MGCHAMGGSDDPGVQKVQEHSVWCGENTTMQRDVHFAACGQTSSCICEWQLPAQCDRHHTHEDSLPSPA